MYQPIGLGSSVKTRPRNQLHHEHVPSEQVTIQQRSNHRDKQRVHAPRNGIIRPNQNLTKLDDDQ